MDKAQFEQIARERKQRVLDARASLPKVGQWGEQFILANTRADDVSTGPLPMGSKDANIGPPGGEVDNTDNMTGGAGHRVRPHAEIQGIANIVRSRGAKRAAERPTGRI